MVWHSRSSVSNRHKIVLLFQLSEPPGAVFGCQFEADGGGQLPEALLARLGMIVVFKLSQSPVEKKAWNATICPNLSALWFVTCVNGVLVASSHRNNSMLADVSKGAIHFLIGWTFMRIYVIFVAHYPFFLTALNARMSFRPCWGLSR